MTESAAPVYDLGDIAFYWRMRNTLADRHPRVPEFLPFSFSFIPALQLIIQTRREETLHWLDEVYKEDQNVGYLQEGHALAEAYGRDFLDFVARVTATHGVKAESFIEVGCGAGYLLAKLKQQGHAVLGIDPSPVSARQAARLGVEVFSAFYPSQSCTRQSDVVFHYDVLEHVADPVAFLRAHHGNLHAGGHIIVAVPDCTASIARGDASMVIHEHLNYFDAEALTATMRMAGFDVLEVAHSGHGGVLYGLGRSNGSNGSNARETHGTQRLDKFSAFTDRLEAFTSSLGVFAREHAGKPGGIALYVPLRLIPYLPKMGIASGFRFFDDDPGTHGKYFDGYDVPVENFADFTARPPSGAIIGSFAFGQRIADKIKAALGTQVALLTLGDIGGAQ